MAKFAGLILVIAGILSTASMGCGGSSGNSTSGKAAPLASTWRTVQVGDNWQWNFTVIEGGVSATGVATEAVTFGGYSTGPYLTYTTVYTYKSGYSTTDISYFSQSLATHSVTLLGGPDGMLASPVVHTPGSWQSDLSFSTYTVEPDNSVVERIFSVVGTEVVTVPAGTFDTWKVEISDFVTGGSASTGTYWFAPQIGEVVKQSSTTTYPPGTTNPSYTYSSEMTKASVVP